MAFNIALKRAIKTIFDVPGIGTTVTFRKVNSGSYNSTTGETRESITDSSVKCVFEDINLREVNDLVQADDRKCTIPAASLSFTPTTKDQVVVSGLVYQIIRVKIVEQGGVNLNYELILRA